jgi:PEP-CTERM motif
MNKTKMFACCAVAAAVALSTHAQATAGTVTVGRSGAPWLGFMNVSELPANGGAYVFGSGWGVADLVATFDDPGSKVTLSPNTIGDPDPFWYVGGGAPGNPGNKNMEANLYIEETGPLAGQTVDFEFEVLSDTTTAAHSGYAFIKDFAPDYSSSNGTVVPLTVGSHTISLATLNDPLRHVQYGFQFVGENVWITDVDPFGSIVIGTVPEPASLVLLGFGGLAMLARRRS